LVHSTRQFVGNSEDLRIKAWLKPPDASINYVNASRLRYPNTGRWFLESDRYIWFKSTPHVRLWLRGIPGCGKTVLASTVVEDLRFDKSLETAVIYFFFSFTDQATQKLDDMLRSLIFQLLASHKSTRVHLTKLLENCAGGTQQSQIKGLVKVFQEIASEVRSVTVILDALDESRERRDLLRWIASFSISTDQHCKFILLSRPERDIEEALASWLPRHGAITLEGESIGGDLKSYIHYRLESESSFQGIKKMHEAILNVLASLGLLSTELVLGLTGPFHKSMIFVSRRL
jgi:hypothetical protein